MRISLKAKLTALISFLVLLVVLASSTLYISSLTRRALLEIQNKGEFVASIIYHQARTVLANTRMPPGTSPEDQQALQRVVQTTLAADPGLASLMESEVGYSPTIYYVSVTDAQRQILVHNDPSEIGHTLPWAPPFGALLAPGIFHQLSIIYGPPQAFEITLSLDMLGKPLGDVRVGVSTAFLRSQINPELRSALWLSLLAIVFSTLTAGALSFRLLRPLETISRRVDLMARGEYTEPLHLNRTDEWGILSSKLNLLGEQMRGEKAAFVALKDNMDQLFSELADGLLLFDEKDRLVLATPAVSKLLGRPREELVHHSADDIFSGSSALDDWLGEKFEKRESSSWQVMEARVREEPRSLAVSVQFVEDGDRPVASLVTLRKAGTRARFENQLDVTVKLAALGRLTSGVAHEFKNPLNAMVLQLELLKTKLENEGQQVKPQIEILSAEIRRLDRVVKTFLDFTRPVELHAAETDLEGLVREVFILAEPHAAPKNIQLVFQRNGELPSVRVDRDLMKQALLNLVLNGCQAMPGGGQLKVIPSVSPKSVDLQIADQGVGIPPEARDKIFTLYFTTKPDGTGVGLAMAYRIVQLHNGSIDFTSEPNRGTTFRVSLPR